MRLHRADDARMRPGQASLQPPRSWWYQQLSNESTEDHPCRTLVSVRSHASFVVVVLGVGLAEGFESPWRVGLTDGIESPTVILRVF